MAVTINEGCSKTFIKAVPSYVERKGERTKGTKNGKIRRSGTTGRAGLVRESPRAAGADANSLQISAAAILSWHPVSQIIRMGQDSDSRRRSILEDPEAARVHNSRSSSAS
ncbi:hypothetical protein EVAR_64681_1 [Eumeta japonica]|uniref:Uncharacterized protein n=1 Tax=Eumeta variegata TaxID=151549 RepID=A0A4C1ZNF3_EUMVA|nr:hypothetical protein EVAR_64681_1 [Eumeta japonica]